MALATSERTMRLIQKLEKLMEERGLKQSELAPMIGVTPQRLSLWLKGTGHPKPQVLLRMARVFAVDVEFLLDDALDVPVQKEPVTDEESKLLWAMRTLGVQAEAVLKLIVPATAAQTRNVGAASDYGATLPDRPTLSSRPLRRSGDPGFLDGPRLPDDPPPPEPQRTRQPKRKTR